MPTQRTYGDPCGIARALDLVGERWALLIARELLLGAKRFTDLRRGLPGVSPDVLSQRLRELEAAGVVARRTLAPPAPARVYELTEPGRQLEPVLLALGRWGSRVALPGASAPLSADALGVALKTMYVPPGSRDGDELRVALCLGEDVLRVRARGDGVEVGRGPSEQPAPHAIAATDSATLAGLLWHGATLADAIGTGALDLEGDRVALVRFLTRFGGPATAGRAAE